LREEMPLLKRVGKAAVKIPVPFSYNEKRRGHLLLGGRVRRPVSLNFKPARVH